jgi:hypothetical protein
MRGMQARDGRSVKSSERLLTVTVCGVLLAIVLVSGGCGTSRLATPRVSATSSMGPRLVRLVRLYRLEPQVMTAAAGRFFAVVATKSHAVVTVVRINEDGTVVRRPLADPLASYFFRSASQGRALFIGTSVIKRFTDAADELLRLDASTLKITARISLPGGVVAIACDHSNLWVALADRVLRLEPVSLAVEASYRIPGATPPPTSSPRISSLARAPGGLWATFGDSPRTWLYRWAPATLAIRSRVAVPESGQGIQLVAGPGSLWLTGENFARQIEPSGRMSAPLVTPGLQAAATHGRSLLVLLYSGNAAERLVEVNQQGAVLARSDVGDAGGRIVVDGHNVWLLHGLDLAGWMLIDQRATRRH